MGSASGSLHHRLRLRRGRAVPVAAEGPSRRATSRAERSRESVSMTVLSVAAEGKLAETQSKRCLSSQLGRQLRRLGAAADPITPIAVSVAPSATALAPIRNLTVRRWLGRPPVREERDGWIRRNGLIHKGETDCEPAMEAKREDRSLAAPIHPWRGSEDGGRHADPRRPGGSWQSTRCLSSRSRSVSFNAPSTNADRSSAKSAQGAFSRRPHRLQTSEF